MNSTTVHSRRVLVLVTDAFGGFGGIAKFNRDLLTALCSFPGYDEIIAIPSLLPDVPGTLPDKLTYLTGGLGGKLNYLLTVLGVTWKTKPFDLVICGHIHLLPVAWLCAKLSNSTLGLIIHGIDAWEPNNSRLVNALVRRIDFFVSVSEFTKEKFCRWTAIPPEKGHILPNCIDLCKYTPGPRNPKLIKKYNLEGKKVIMTLGRMSASERYKGFDEILGVLPEIVKKNPEVVYLVVGDGDDRPRLQQKAELLGLAKRVIFTGNISENEKIDHYRLADVFVMPGRGEGFGIVYLEALACGVPVIGSKLDGSRDALLGGKLGLLVNPADSEELIAGIEKILTKRRAIPEEIHCFSFECFSRSLQLILEKNNLIS